MLTKNPHHNSYSTIYLAHFKYSLKSQYQKKEFYNNSIAIEDRNSKINLL